MLTDYLHSQRIDRESRLKRPDFGRVPRLWSGGSCFRLTPRCLRQFTMAAATPSNPAAITMHVGKSEFTFHNNRVLLSLAIPRLPAAAVR